MPGPKGPPASDGGVGGLVGGGARGGGDVAAEERAAVGVAERDAAFVLGVDDAAVDGAAVAQGPDPLGQDVAVGAVGAAAGVGAVFEGADRAVGGGVALGVRAAAGAGGSAGGNGASQGGAFVVLHIF